MTAIFFTDCSIIAHMINFDDLICCNAWSAYKVTDFVFSDYFQAAIFDQFQVPASKLRIYFHYQPSYAHLHVHFTHVKFDAPGSDCLRAHLVEDVISNLQIDGDFYKKKLLMFVVREHEDLYKSYKAAGHFE